MFRSLRRPAVGTATRGLTVAAGLALATALTASPFALAQAPAAAPATLTDAEAKALATDAYIYGYPLVTMEMTRRVMTNVSTPEGTRAPMGQFVRMREYPTAAFRDVTAPNADTLYTTTWLDVSKEPWILSLPDFGDRYFLFPMLDGWTNVFEVPGKRTTGGKAAKYAITGPGWHGTLPAGVTEYKSPTGIVWILGRIYCDGTPADYAAVHKLQDQVSVVPLSAYGKPFNPPAGKVDTALDMKTAVRDQVNALDASAYFTMLASLMKDNPPSAADAPMLAKLAKLGVMPGRPFDARTLGPAAAAALKDVPKTAFGQIMAFFPKAGTNENGWMFTTKTGLYGTNYLGRALVTVIGLGANRPQDAVYPTSETDGTGQPYDGSKKYVMHIEKGQMPPVNGFWSLTMYDGNYFFVANPLNRFTLGSRSKFKENADGSVDLYIQNEDPGPDRQANWLPAPKGKFILMLRLYWPKENPPSILDGSWKIPAVLPAK